MNEQEKFFRDLLLHIQTIQIALDRLESEIAEEADSKGFIVEDLLKKED